MKPREPLTPPLTLSSKPPHLPSITFSTPLPRPHPHTPIRNFHIPIPVLRPQSIISTTAPPTGISSRLEHVQVREENDSVNPKPDKQRYLLKASPSSPTAAATQIKASLASTRSPICSRTPLMKRTAFSIKSA